MAAFVETWLQQESLSTARTNLLANAETSLDMINNDIKLSGSVDDTNRWDDANGPGGNPTGWTSGSQTLVLAKAAVDSSNNILYSDPSSYITQKDNEVYYLSGTTLYRRTIRSSSSTDAAVTTCPAALATSGCPADEVVATGVSSLNFSYYDASENIVTPTNARSIQTTITLSSLVGGQTAKATYATRMVFRNK